MDDMSDNNQVPIPPADDEHDGADADAADNQEHVLLPKSKKRTAKKIDLRPRGKYNVVITILFAVTTCSVCAIAVYLCYLHKLTQDAMRERVQEEDSLKMNIFSSDADKNANRDNIHERLTTLEPEVTSVEPQPGVNGSVVIIIYPCVMVVCMIVSVSFVAAGFWRESTYESKMKKSILKYSMLIFHAANSALLIHLVTKNVTDRIDGFGTEATCYCSPVASRASMITHAMYHCLCMAPSEETPWQLFVNNPAEIDDVALRDLGSEYEGVVRAIYQETLMDEMSASKMHIAELNKLINIIQVCIPFLSLQITMWSVLMYIANKVKNRQDTVDVENEKMKTNALVAGVVKKVSDSIDSKDHAEFWEHIKNVLEENAFMFGEAIDFFSLIDDLVAHGRDFTMDRPMAYGILAVFGYGLFVMYIIYPVFEILENIDNAHKSGNTGEGNKSDNIDSANRSDDTSVYDDIGRVVNHSEMIIKVLTMTLSLSLLIIRVVLFNRYDNMVGKRAPTFFMLFMMKESYGIIQTITEISIEKYFEKKQKE